ncbi:hypothetical protein [Costertonia aggregata]|uniref:Uncharacterized protein n=1 Tax=Costertonia aggregata TaxID=343403 RepID=A0A7H9AR33_9FLAO|nr:hypothetical protein [Costertonia aggregata]QLG45903.1 hypothetical protein HYG79_11270 [Costertonia aggregata]
MKLRIIVLYAIVSFLTGNLIYAQTESKPVSKSEENIVIIKQYYKKPPSTQKKNSILLKGVSEGEFIEIKIQGLIKDFEHIKLEMGNDGDLYEIKTLNKFEQLSNQTLIIKSVIPEGIPMEKIKWKSLSDKEYEYIIAENGKDGQQMKFNLE